MIGYLSSYSTVRLSHYCAIILSGLGTQTCKYVIPSVFQIHSPPEKTTRQKMNFEKVEELQVRWHLLAICLSAVNCV